MSLALDGTTGISASGNITGGNVIASGSLIVGTFSPTSVSASGNITGSFIIGNGSQLTGLPAGYTNSNLATLGSNVISTTGTITGGNITGGNLLTAGLISATSTITSAANITGGNLLTAGLISATGTINGTTFTGTSLTVSTGNITAGNLLLSGAIVDSAQLDIQTSASNANIALAPNGTGVVTVSTQVSAVGNVTGGNFRTAGLVTATGNVDAGNLRTAGLISATGAITGAALTGTSLTVSTGNVSCGNIVNTNANGVGNIGSTGTRFNQVFALASSAQYADLAEKYTADAEYAPGTVVVFGGTAEVTVNTIDSDRRVAGVVSTNPAYIMNDTLESAHVVTVALTGRVPTSVTGTVAKGDLMVSAGNGKARAEANPAVGTVIGKALADSEGDAVIEVVVGRV
jgi:filamentous hemagglutinin